MILFVYKNGLCDPSRDVGTCRELQTTAQVDEYVKLLAGNIKPNLSDQIRVFIGQSHLDLGELFQEIDHYVLMGNYLGPASKDKFNELNFKDFVYEEHKRYASAMERLDTRTREMQKAAAPIKASTGSKPKAKSNSKGGGR
jgi:hypothetical protein